MCHYRGFSEHLLYELDMEAQSAVASFTICIVLNYSNGLSLESKKSFSFAFRHLEQ